MLSPSERNKVDASPYSARSCSIVPANFTVLPSMRPWKSLMLSRLMSTSVGLARSNPTIAGSWSDERNASAT